MVPFCNHANARDAFDVWTLQLGFVDMMTDGFVLKHRRGGLEGIYDPGINQACCLLPLLMLLHYLEASFLLIRVPWNGG